MLAVIFEAIPAEGKADDYISIAGNLRPMLEQMEGFVSIERFRSLSNPEKILSLSFWKDEESVKQWRNLDAHREAQARGRSSVFADYRLRVAEVIRDYGLQERGQAPADSKIAHA